MKVYLHLPSLKHIGDKTTLMKTSGARGYIIFNNMIIIIEYSDNSALIYYLTKYAFNDNIGKITEDN